VARPAHAIRCVGAHGEAGHRAPLAVAWLPAVPQAMRCFLASGTSTSGGRGTHRTSPCQRESQGEVGQWGGRHSH
jgi:hypothetical protein